MFTLSKCQSLDKMDIGSLKEGKRKAMNISSDNITELQENEIFVFSSDESGRRGKDRSKVGYRAELTQSPP